MKQYIYNYKFFVTFIRQVESLQQLPVYVVTVDVKNKLLIIYGLGKNK
jgi:hypothetical protein